MRHLFGRLRGLPTKFQSMTWWRVQTQAVPPPPTREATREYPLKQCCLASCFKSPPVNAASDEAAAKEEGREVGMRRSMKSEGVWRLKTVSSLQSVCWKPPLKSVRLQAPTMTRCLGSASRQWRKAWRGLARKGLERPTAHLQKERHHRRGSITSNVDPLHKWK